MKLVPIDYTLGRISDGFCKQLSTTVSLLDNTVNSINNQVSECISTINTIYEDVNEFNVDQMFEFVDQIQIQAQELLSPIGYINKLCQSVQSIQQLNTQLDQIEAILDRLDGGTNPSSGAISQLFTKTSALITTSSSSSSSSLKQLQTQSSGTDGSSGSSGSSGSTGSTGSSSSTTQTNWALPQNNDVIVQFETIVSNASPQAKFYTIMFSSFFNGYMNIPGSNINYIFGGNDGDARLHNECYCTYTINDSSVKSKTTATADSNKLLFYIYDSTKQSIKNWSALTADQIRLFNSAKCVVAIFATQNKISESWFSGITVPILVWYLDTSKKSKQIKNINYFLQDMFATNKSLCQMSYSQIFQSMQAKWSEIQKFNVKSFDESKVFLKL